MGLAIRVISQTKIWAVLQSPIASAAVPHPPSQIAVQCEPDNSLVSYSLMTRKVTKAGG